MAGDGAALHCTALGWDWTSDEATAQCRLLFVGSVNVRLWGLRGIEI